MHELGEWVDSLEEYLPEAEDLNRRRHNVLEINGSKVPTPEPVGLSPLARKVLETETAGRTPCQKTCQLCQVTCTTEQDWKKHMRSKRHHAIARRTKRRALVVVEPEARPEARPEKEAEVAIAAESRDSSPEIGLSAFGLPAP
ncbi:hypothetical protein BN1723_009996 [Verticillium longisporum]|uniref:C2H2-type domain-containing protein n=1 Tax=Verticillium longisporum TaxID=100787 RepID=A0A0G4KVD1_VERLO|nr:hypothetical protein BN1723_009996 [Verticillium longisporum]